MSRGNQADEIRFDEPQSRGSEPPGDRLRGILVVVVTVVVTVVVVAVALRVEYALVVSPPEDPGPQRLHPAVQVDSEGGHYAFSDTFRGEPVTYSPCTPIRILVNDARMPRRAHGLVEDAVDRVVAATGLDLRVAGRTDATPGAMRSLRFAGPEVRPAPVLLAWTTPRHERALAGDATGIGRSVASAGSGRPRFVTGAVALDAPALAGFLTLPGGRALVRAVVMRELAHLVGLDDVRDPAELMNRDNLGLVDFGPGDREGLALLGRGACA